MPVLNEERFLAGCLRSILADSTQDIELLIVDGGSSDRSVDIAKSFADSDSRVLLLENPGRTAARAMNIGLRRSRGVYIVRADAHCEYPADYFSASVSELERTGADNVGGNWNIRPGEMTTVARAIAICGSTLFGVGNSRYRLNSRGGNVDTVPFGGYRRELFERLGGFQENLDRREDYELNSRIRANGGKIFLSPLVRCDYFSPGTVRRFLDKMFANGYWNLYSCARYPYSFALRHLVPMSFVSFLFATLWLAMVGSRLAVIAEAAVALYLLLAVVSAVQPAFRAGARFFFLLPPLFVMSHITYGLGSLSVAWRTPFLLMQSLRRKDPAGSPYTIPPVASE